MVNRPFTSQTGNGPLAVAVAPSGALNCPVNFGS